MFDKPILVGLTDNHRSDNALRMGRLLAARFGVQLQVVHAVRERDLLTGNVAEGKQAVAEAHLLNAVRATVTAHMAELDATGGQHGAPEYLQVRTGHPAEVLIGQAEELGAELLLLGSHLRRGFIDFGSTARAVLTHAPCAVWVQVDKPVPVRRILAPLDFSEDSLHALDVACELGARLGATVTVLHCFVPPDFAYTPRTDSTMPTYVVDDQRRLARERLEAVVASKASKDVAVEADFLEGEPVSTLLARRRDTDLIVMATHGRGAVSATVLGSVTYAVLRESEVPVVAVRHPTRVKGS